MHLAGRAFLLLTRFWRSRERLRMNQVRSLLSMCCMLLGYGLEPRPNSLALATAGSFMTKFNLESRDQLTKKKDRILIKDLISYNWKYRNKRSKANFTVGNNIFLLPIFRKARPSFFRVLRAMIKGCLHSKKINLTRENKIDQSRRSGCGELSGLT